ncbi:HlyIII-domain-containing protein [Coniophora puteana RWD-64-598 SS2]|uniref:HlyIII-domain-containing protein n=1 Tax=Coniophora puteana (strain RWD-64-598) TaxID=741705 RepID=A0A5M3MN58_CONPW|nr:HlyIII-domain-containing protein [Coniophora puteana RWD-64-598 SS2]EIW80450.1 HlyIII-domain-containing protein [Coniophora puteana RWD-64-598 SS2]
MQRTKAGGTQSRPFSLKVDVPNGFSESPGASPTHDRPRRKVSKTLTWDDIPPWQRDNEHILTGYRHVQNSWRGCIGSVFGYLHNETINIHSHLLGAALFLLILCSFQTIWVAGYASASWVDTSLLATFLLSAIFCLSGSATFHAAIGHSEQVFRQCHALDYSGIVVLIVGSFIPCLYYGFYCEPLAQTFHLGLIFSAGAGAAYTVLNPEYAKPSHRGARTGVFIGLGLTAIVPVTQLVFTRGSVMFSEMGFGWLLLSGALYIFGALIYANRIPERLSPGQFDYFFASHQIFHVCVVLAALAHWVCLISSFQHWHSKPDACLV